MPWDKEKQREYSHQWYLANKERVAPHRAAYKRKNKEKWYASARAWEAKNPEKKGYINHKSHAKRRGIPFLLTFEEWWAVWEQSGKWEQRGFRKGQYVMARFADQGAYEVGNVRICTVSENALERAANWSDESRARMAAWTTRAWQEGKFDKMLQERRHVAAGTTSTKAPFNAVSPSEVHDSS